MKLTTIKKALAIGAFAAGSGIASQAMAAPVFSFTEYGGFVADQVGVADYSNPVAGDVSVVPGTPVYSKMSWNSGQTPQSSLVLSTVQAPTLLDAGDWVTISTLTHNNIVIQNAADWGPQDILGRLRITDSDGGPVTVLDNEDAIEIFLTETPNSGGCPMGNPVGSVCDDVFTFTASGLADINFFANDGSKWVAQFRLANLFNAVQIGPSVFTGEAASSSLDVQIRLTEVPEPATLGIFGLGLLGLGMIRRRKQSI